DVQDRTGALDDLHEQYPATEAEALAPRQLDKRLPPDWLTECYRPAVPLPSSRGTPAVNGLTVFAAPVPGRTYVIGADPAEGNPTSNGSAATVLDVETGEEVACLVGKFEPATFAAHVARLSQWYGNAPAMVERNNHGHAVLLWLRDNAPRTTLLLGDDKKIGFA